MYKHLNEIITFILSLTNGEIQNNLLHLESYHYFFALSYLKGSPH